MTIPSFGYEHGVAMTSSFPPKRFQISTGLVRSGLKNRWSSGSDTGYSRRSRPFLDDATRHYFPKWERGEYP